MLIKDQEKLNKMLTMRLDGKTFKQIAESFGLSRQRVQQYLSPPRNIRGSIIAKYNGKCADCGLFVGISGHVHHKGTKNEDYNDTANLELLCISCHRINHNNIDGVLHGERQHIVVDNETFQAIKQLAGDVPLNRFLKRVIQELLEKNKKEKE